MGIGQRQGKDRAKRRQREGRERIGIMIKMRKKIGMR